MKTSKTFIRATLFNVSGILMILTTVLFTKPDEYYFNIEVQIIESMLSKSSAVERDNFIKNVFSPHFHERWRNKDARRFCKRFAFFCGCIALMLIVVDWRNRVGWIHGFSIASAAVSMLWGDLFIGFMVLVGFICSLVCIFIKRKVIKKSRF